MNRRLETIKYSLARHTFGGSARDWLMNIFHPPLGILKKRFITRIETEDGFHKIFLKGLSDPIYLSATIPLFDFYRSAVEQLCGWHWHNYLIPETGISPEDIVFDCGCAEGIFPMIARKSAKQIHAFEPLPLFIAGLQRTFKHDKNINIVECALGRAPGTAYLQADGAASILSYKDTGIPVRIETIDHFCQEHQTEVNFIKADLEGFEMEMLAGAAESIAKFKPKIAITTYHEPDHARQIREFLARVVPAYHFKLKGITHFQGAPVMLHAWVPQQ